VVGINLVGKERIRKEKLFEKKKEKKVVGGRIYKGVVGGNLHDK